MTGSDYRKILAGASLAIALAPAALAQSADDTLNVGASIQIDAAGAAVSGLQDISVSYDGTGFSLIEDTQTFCVFTPTQFFNMDVSGANSGPTSGNFYAVDSLQTDPALDRITYFIFIRDVFSRTNAPLGSSPLGLFQNGVTETGIDSNLFNTDDTCTDGENLSLKFSMALDAAGPNGPIVSQLVDGIKHDYTDTLTITITPAL